MISEDILTTLNNVFRVLVFFGFYDICSSSDKSGKVLCKETLASFAKVLSNWHNRQVLAICICHFSTCVCAACVSSCFVFQCFCVCACLPLQRCNAKKGVFVKKGSNLVLQGLLPGFACFVVYITLFLSFVSLRSQCFSYIRIMSSTYFCDKSK